MLKRIALRGALILGIVIALCMFFAQTIITITTPKVKIVRPTTGRLEQKIPLTAELYFGKTESFTLEAAKKVPIVVEAVWAQAGDSVKEGETLFTARLGEEYQTELEKARQELYKAQEDALKLEMDNLQIKKTDSPKNQAYREWAAARDALLEVNERLIALGYAQGISPEEDESLWMDALLTGGDIEIRKLAEAVPELEKTLKDKQSAFLKAFGGSSVPKETFEFLQKREDARRDIAKKQSALLEMMAGAEALKVVRAPREGILAKMEVEAGAAYAGDKAAFQMAVSAPVLRADISEVRKELSEGTKVEMKDEWGSSVSTTIASVARAAGGRRLANIELTEEMQSYMGGLRGFIDKKIELKALYRAKSNTTLLPASAVRSEGEGNDYVYMIEQQYGFFSDVMVVRKLPVRVIERADKICSVEEQLQYAMIADGEDRDISKEGARVMEYLE